MDACTSATTTARSSRTNFVISTIPLFPNSQFTNHESLPPLHESFTIFSSAFPHYAETMPQFDAIRHTEYPHLSNQVSLDYTGVGLFSHSQAHNPNSSSKPSPFFTISHNSTSLEFESRIKSNIMSFLKISPDDYFMICTASRTTAFKLVAETYPFHSNNRLVTVYDYESEGIIPMVECALNRGAKVKSAAFLWPGLSIHSLKLKKLLGRKKKRKKEGLFVFPVMSRITGVRYPYIWMKMAQEKGWHVVLDACTLGPKEMDTMGMALIRPDFIVCSFYKVFGENPSGFAGLFVKKSSRDVLETSVIARSIGVVRIVRAGVEEEEEDDMISQEDEEIELRCLNHADLLGLPVIQTRLRCTTNWLVIALKKLRHPNSGKGESLVRIYGPEVRFDRGSAIAFNLYDWRGEKVEPVLVQKLADRSDISLSCGFLKNIWFSDHRKYEQEKHGVLEKKRVVGVFGEGGRKKKERIDVGIAVVSVSLGFLVNFEDAYRFWVFVAKSLDADFVEKERWRYVALNQRSVEI